MKIAAHIERRDDGSFRNTLDGSEMVLVESANRRFVADRCAVSNRRFKKFLAAHSLPLDHFLPPRLADEYSFPPDYATHPDYDDSPAVAMPHATAAAYAAWVNGALPTTDEWTFAVYGDDGRRYPWGDSWDDDKCQHLERALLDPIRDEERHLVAAGEISGIDYLFHSPPVVPVDGFPDAASAHGLLCALGNVEEWSADVRAPGSGRSLAAAVLGGSYRSLREELTREQVRRFLPAHVNAPWIGFRCVVAL